MDAPFETLLIDPNKLFREGLKLLVEGQGFRLSAEAGSLPEAHQAVEAGLRPALVLIDPTPGNGEEREHMKRLRLLLPEAKLVVLTGELSTPLLASALEAEIDGYLIKDLSAQALCQSLRLVMIGEKVFPSHLAALLISGRVSAAAPDIQPGRGGLSQREVQIMRCLVNGDSNKTIANHLNITEATVKVHLKSLLRKINASNRTQAAIWALNNGIGSRDMRASA
jgi:two-component system nitrate/nitrite response regulator NarL